jgi:hypothetical protein
MKFVRIMFTIEEIILDIIFGAIGGVIGALTVLKITEGKK